MKRILTLVLALVLAVSTCGSAFALNFTGELGNESTFETLAEAHANSPAIVKGIIENEEKTFVGHPALDGYPKDTTYVYRSANQYAGRAAARLNTNIFLYAEQHFADKDEAFAYLQSTGLIDLIEEAVGSIVLVTPVGENFAREDADFYYALQTAMLAQKDSGVDSEGNAIYYSDAEYFGGYGYLYFIGIDGGATFFNNYIAPEIDFAGRLAGALLIGGEMQEIREPSIFIPMYMVNADEDVLDKYIEVNGADAMRKEGDITTYYNQAWPLRKVIAENVNEVEAASIIKDAYYNMFVKAMRVPVLTQAVYSAGTPYSGYNFDEAPYSLCDRNIVIDGKTADGICLIKHQSDDTFVEYKTSEGEYIDTWYEYLPEEVLNGTAEEGSIPLILANHGGGDDVRVFVEEFGLLELAGQERIAVVAPDHQLIAEVRGPALAAVVKYMLETYPALDASRVYATGYSMGGGASYTVGYYEPTLFAAIAPIAGSPTAIPEDQIANFDNCELPVFFAVSAFDGVRRLVGPEGHLNEESMEMVTLWSGFNGITQTEYDFETYPIIGFEGDAFVQDTVNDEYEKLTWYLNNEAGEPRVAFAYVKGMIHALYPEYASMFWDFVSNFSRNPETGEIIYNPYY